MNTTENIWTEKTSIYIQFHASCKKINRIPWTKTIYGGCFMVMLYTSSIISLFLPAAKKTKELSRIKYLLCYYTFLPSQTVGFVLATRSAPRCISAKTWSVHALPCPKLPFRILITQKLELTCKEWMNIRLVLVLLWYYILFMLYTAHSAPDDIIRVTFALDIAAVTKAWNEC